jgi:hypothetical protein
MPDVRALGAGAMDDQRDVFWDGPGAAHAAG